MKSSIKKGFVNIIIALIIGALAVCTGAFIDKSFQTKTDTKVGAINYVTGGGTYRLASSVSSTQTSIKLSSFLEPVSGTPYTMAYLNSSLEYGTLDPQTNNSEFISFTGITQNADGTATLTGVTRGLGRSYPYTSATVYKLTHSGQSIFILSNTPQVYNDIYTYINSAITSGTVDATTVIKGIVQLSTANQAASHTAIGGGATTAALALTSNIASSTRTANTAQVVIASSTTGYIDQSYIATSSPQGSNLFNNSALTGTTTIRSYDPMVMSFSTSTPINGTEVSLSKIPSQKDYMKILIMASTTNSSGTSAFNLTFNNDVTANYFLGVPTGVSSAVGSTSVPLLWSTAGIGSQIFCSLDIHNSNGTNKFFSGTCSGYDSTNALVFAVQRSGVWRNVASINKITVTSGTAGALLSGAYIKVIQSSN